jgi:hypothetical protein
VLTHSFRPPETRLLFWLRNAREEASVSFLVLRGQLSSPGRSWGSGGAGEPIEAIGNLQDRSPRAEIGQLPSHLPRLLGAVEPLQGFVQHRWHFGPPSVVSCRGSFSLPKLRLRYQGHTEPNAETTSHTAPQSPTDRSSTTISPTARANLGIVSACRCIWLKSRRMTAPGNSGVARWWHYSVAHGSVLSALLSAFEVPQTLDAQTYC